MGITWLSSGWDSMLSPLRAQVQFLVGELRSHQPCGTAEKKKNNLYSLQSIFKFHLFSQKCSLYLPSPPSPSPVQGPILDNASCFVAFFGDFDCV